MITDGEQQSLQSFHPTMRHRKLIDNPFYALTIHKKYLLTTGNKGIDAQQMRIHYFPKRKQCKSKQRSHTQPDHVELPMLQSPAQQRMPKNLHIHFNLNYFVSEHQKLCK